MSWAGPGSPSLTFSSFFLLNGRHLGGLDAVWHSHLVVAVLGDVAHPWQGRVS